MSVLWGMMVSMMLTGFPFVVVILGSLLVYAHFQMPELTGDVLVQQMLTGITPPTLVCVPLFILGANLITAGDAATRLVNMIRVFTGHIPGGLPITTNASCTLFGAVSGSTQATVAAVGKTMRPMLMDAGYKSSFSLGLIINASDIALLIPPSIGFIVYGVVTQTSIGDLFLAGIFPGILIFVLFSLYSIAYSHFHKVGVLPKATRAERKKAMKEGVLVLGFPIIIIGGIYSGIFSPTESAAAGVFYALILEGLIYRTLSFKKLRESLLDASVITAVVFILVGAGQALSWLIGFLQIPQEVMPILIGENPGELTVVFAVIIGYFVACMFVDPIVAIYVLSPIFQPYIIELGIDPLFIGVLVVLQAAMGSATPPFGCDIFTAQLIFRRPYLEVIKHTLPFTLIEMGAAAIIIIFPQIATFLPSLAPGGGP
ncbi:MAG: TRAP transporter large permease [Kiritimatiellae bacterium]|jgi:C4-dicarboxylate transporter DctM subunit|nr:TRAP transporter large permease [Kiritimatiellia bacterium]